MKRREFLSAFAAVAPLPFLSRERLGEGRLTLLIQSSPLAGFQYHDAERVWSRLRIGSKLTLVREPQNKYDSRAVRIDWRDHKLGYVPRLDNAAVSQMLDRGQWLEARIERLRESLDPWTRVLFRVELRC